MKTVKKKSILLVVAMMLVLSLTVGLTLAYFSDYEAAKGGASIALGGQTEIEENVTDKEKVVQINNIGETNVVVRVAIYMPEALEKVENSITFENASDWVKDGGFYYYTKVLAPGESTSKITAKTTVPDDVQLGDNFDVVVVHESDQALYDESNKVVLPDGWADHIN
jgi:predicted ribosomally synthesized peptide with SipW-like signal peptide